MKKWFIVITLFSLPLFSQWSSKAGFYGNVLPLPGVGLSTRVSNGGHTGFELDVAGGTALVATGFTASLNYLCYIAPQTIYLGVGGGALSDRIKMFHNFPSHLNPLARIFCGIETRSSFIDGGLLAYKHKGEIQTLPTLRFSFNY